MVDGDVLEKEYKERLEENIISYLADKLGCSLNDAMDIYYKGSLSDKINKGVYGIQYLDYKNLAEIFINTEVHT